MEVRDVVHGSIPIEKHEYSVLGSVYFQRLRQIKQLGFAENAFPSATHTRYIHSLGAAHTASQAFSFIFSSGQLPSLPTSSLKRFRAVLRFAALLHDVGHGPLSHTTEFAMPAAETLSVPLLLTNRKGKANHEDYTLKIILDSSLTPLLDQALRPFDASSVDVAALICSEIPDNNETFKEALDGQSINFRPILQQLISSELDADRMDYLRRDSFYTGASYGQFDFDWLVSHLSYHLHNNACHLALRHRALYTFEDFLISRFHMFLMVYFHHKSVIFDELLSHYFDSADCDYELPSNIERYAEFNDSQLYSHLAKSKNPWANRITERRPYERLLEIHSGIPAGREAFRDQQAHLEKIEDELTAKGIHFIKTTTTSEISKYFSKPSSPIFVLYNNYYNAPTPIPLDKCTDLFKKYEDQRSIQRIYVSPEDALKIKRDVKPAPLKF